MNIDRGNKTDTYKNETVIDEEQFFRNKITIISFFCSLMVIWIHTYNLDTYGITKESSGIGFLVYSIETHWSQIITLAVPFFFMISGYLYFRTFDIHNLIGKYKSRIRGIVIPYLIWCSIYWCYFAAFTNIPFLRRFTSADVVELSIKSYLMALWPNQYYTLWFLKNLIIFILIGPVLFFVLKDVGKIKIGTVLIVLVILNSYFGWLDIGISGISYYCIGAYLALNQRKLFECKKKRQYVIMAALLLMLLLTVGLSLLSNICVIYLVMMLVWIALDGVEIKRNLPWWMKITFFVYVSHDIVLEMLEKVFFISFGAKPIFALIDYAVVPLVIYGILCLLACFMRKSIPLVWDVITGGRA